MMKAPKKQEFGPERDAAQFLGLTQSRFRRLVQNGSLPGPISIDDKTQVWDLVQIGRILRKESTAPTQGFSI